MIACAKAPCPSCPYRKDVPSGVWAPSEYEKLPRYDLPTHEQPVGVFMCHQQDGKICAGWVGCHDGYNLMALRFALARRKVDPEVLKYKSPVPLFTSGAEAAAHGMADVEMPGDAAWKMMDKLDKRLQRKKPKRGE